MFPVSAKCISFEWLSAGPCVAIRQGHGGRNAVVAAIAEGKFFPVVVRRSHASRSAKAKVDGMPLSPREAGAISSKWWSAGPCVAIGKGNGCREAVVTVAGARHSLSMAARLSMSPLAGRQGKSNVAAAVIVREGSQARLATWRHSRSAVCVVVFRCPHFVCLPAVCWVGVVFQSPPVDSKVRLHMRQRRRVGAFGSASGRIPCGALGLVPACRAGWDRPGRGAAAHLYVLVTLLCIFWPTRSPRAAGHPKFLRFGDVCFAGRYVVAGGNTASNAPDPFQHPKLSGAGPG